MRTSSCWRLPSRAAFSRRNTASETSGLPMKTRSTGRTSCARGGAGQRQIGAVEIDDMAARVGDGEAVEGVVGDAAHHGIVGLAVGEADDAGGKGEQIEQADHRQHAPAAREYRAAPGCGRSSSARPRSRPERPRPAAPARSNRRRRSGSWRSRRLRRRIVVDIGGHGGKPRPSGHYAREFRSRAGPECLNRAAKRKGIRPLFGVLRAF